MKSGKRALRRGAAVVELAVTVPLLLILAFGTLEATTAIHLRQSLEVCAYEGARVALLPGTTSSNVQAACESMLLDRGVSNATVQVTPSNFSGRPYGTEINVEISTTMANNSPIPMLVLRNKTIVGSVTMMKER